MNVLILDSDNLICRAFYGIPLMFATDGTPTNAIRGFCNTLLNLKEQVSADLIVAAFDAGIPENRKVASPEYKANRGEKPEELEIQLEICAQLVCRALCIPFIKEKNVEADDILYTMALRCSELGHNAFLASGDKDTAQCLDLPNTTLLRPTNKISDPWVSITKETAKGIFGVEPYQIPDYLAILGDACDNLVGVKGAGAKTASKWLQEFGSIPNILANIEHVKPERLQKELIPELLTKNLIVTKAYDTGHALPEKKEREPNKEFFNSLNLYRITNRL